MVSISQPTSNAQLACNGLGFSFGPRVVLDRIDLSITADDRIGVIGPNGTGKSTLLRLLVGDLEPASGGINIAPADATVGLLTQQLSDLPGESIAQFVSRKTGIEQILHEFEESSAALATGGDGAADRYDRALSRFLATEAATFEAQTTETLDAVGLTGIDPDRRTADLSGGQRTRLNLAAILLSSFDILLLDEPTNDLDLDGLALLEGLVTSPGRPMALVSHDRMFLERTVTSVFELDDHSHSGQRFNGGYTAWEEAREVAKRHEQEAFDEYTRKRSDLRSRAQTQRQWSVKGVKKAKADTSERDKNIKAFNIATSEKLAGKAKMTERALERLDRNEKVEKPWQPWDLRLRFREADRSGTEVASLVGAVVRLGDFELGPVDLTITAGERVMITGPNGAGKSTLLRALVGEQPLDSGASRLGPSVRVGTLRQSREVFEAGDTLLEAFAGATGLDTSEARSQLAKLGLDSEKIRRPAQALSPGEQTRAVLGVFAALGSNLLILDEPTNHLDLPAIEQLESALEIYPHTVLLVTHDRRMIERFNRSRRLHVTDGKVVDVGVSDHRD